jgi:hypothetical protein
MDDILVLRWEGSGVMKLNVVMACYVERGLSETCECWDWFACWILILCGLAFIYIYLSPVLPLSSPNPGTPSEETHLGVPRDGIIPNIAYG